ncbi:fructose PTS transporter subunit IIA [Pectinatus frisingensis]|jgi:PTS system fructose-specific IIA component|uniref:fructose PTS transporter subunit IIA n=1 Tax=Pectinatus frisingensis TaxID=865 RepID=UPI0015F60968|nr:fructose PTS transporter subunit IIA [Pectinatus frisingensis]
MNNLITDKMIMLDQSLKTKDEVIRTLAQKINNVGRLNDICKYIEAVKKREADFPTSMGFCVAIPHGKSDAVKTSSLAFLRLNEMVKWSEEENVKYIFMIAVPSENSDDEHLKILAALSRHLMHEDFRKKLMTIQNAHELVDIIENM